MSIHHLQTWPDSCVAAAMCMIQRWRGEAPTEARFYADNSCYSPHYIKTLPGIEARLVEPGMEHELRVDLIGQVVVVMALTRNYEGWRSAAYPHLRSPHGTPSSGYHIVVLISATHDGYCLLDPFYPVTGQPFEVSDDDFVGWFTGHAFIASP